MEADPDFLFVYEVQGLLRRKASRSFVHSYSAGSNRNVLKHENP